jgi:acetyl-CoA carboxylase biotin carboxyl carrier protein
MDQRELKKLVQLMNDNELVELEIEREGERVHLRKACNEQVRALPLHAVAPPAPAAAAPVETPVPEEPPAPAEIPPGTQELRSPMVGTFYRRPSPDAPPYVEVGDAVDEDSVVCILEAMKVNNEIKAELEGEIVEILVEDGQPVEFDQPLFLVRT